MAYFDGHILSLDELMVILSVLFVNFPNSGLTLAVDLDCDASDRHYSVCADCERPFVLSHNVDQCATDCQNAGSTALTMTLGHPRVICQSDRVTLAASDVHNAMDRDLFCCHHPTMRLNGI